MSTTDTFSTQGLGGILKFNKDTGPAVSSRANIFEDLCHISKAAFGEEFVIEQGTEWYSFLNMLSYVLGDFGGACVDMYNSMSVNNATGKNLDSICALNGIIRKAAEPAKVTLTLTTEINKPLYIDPGATMSVADSAKRIWSWTNTEKATVKHGDEQSSVAESFDLEFECTSEDSVHAGAIAPESTWTLVSASGFGYTDGITFKNENSNKSGYKQESDGALRYRYLSSNFKQASGTVEGLRAQLLNISDVTYCVIQQDTGNHTIEVVLDTAGHAPALDDKLKVNIADTIILYKSLGCGLAYPEGVNKEDEDFKAYCISQEMESSDYGGAKDKNYVVEFMMCVPVSWGVNYVIEGSDEDFDYTKVDEAIKKYVNSLSPGTSVKYHNIYTVINSALSAQDGDYELSEMELKDSAEKNTNRIDISYWQYADEPSITHDKSSNSAS